MPAEALTSGSFARGIDGLEAARAKWKRLADEIHRVTEVLNEHLPLAAAVILGMATATIASHFLRLRA